MENYPNPWKGWLKVRWKVFSTPRSRLVGLVDSDAGMASSEYAIVTIAAAALAGILYAVVTGEPVTAALEGLVRRALDVAF
ncbi:DUF4244 domain-containing protein [Allokutzneria albata]|uniref:DUF4244 domain-containing protein n=1 Tax=Allokutzneria albata TaxID=211114 RepID=UPI0009DFFE4C|nr:DUF4244 domain-containing protein [Allokutzneria albata]